MKLTTFLSTVCLHFSFTEGDTVALRESLAQLSGASSPAESVVSTSSNPSATSSVRGGNYICLLFFKESQLFVYIFRFTFLLAGRREKGRRGKKKGHSGSSKSASRGSDAPVHLTLIFLYC